jgi:hypothetical protein
MTFDYNFFIKDVNDAFMKHCGTQRYGQFMANYLSENYSYLEIPIDIDPFYDNSKIPDLMRYLNSISQ